MKIVAINQIEFNDKSGKKVVVAPGQVFDIAAESADRLLVGLMPAARRMTSDEIELDKARAANKAAAEPTEPADPVKPAAAADPVKPAAAAGAKATAKPVAKAEDY